MKIGHHPWCLFGKIEAMYEKKIFSNEEPHTVGPYREVMTQYHHVLKALRENKLSKGLREKQHRNLSFRCLRFLTCTPMELPTELRDSSIEVDPFSAARCHIYRRSNEEIFHWLMGPIQHSIKRIVHCGSSKLE